MMRSRHGSNAGDGTRQGPRYFADPANIEKLRPFQAVPIAHQQEALLSSARSLQPTLEAALAAVRVPLGALCGAESPMPVSASTDVTDRVPGAWTEVVPGAGHFIWLEQPDAPAAALDRLLG